MEIREYRTYNEGEILHLYVPSEESQVFGKWTTPATEAEIAQAIGK